jgi:hypothetical protein
MLVVLVQAVAVVLVSQVPPLLVLLVVQEVMVLHLLSRE